MKKEYKNIFLKDFWQNIKVDKDSLFWNSKVKLSEIKD
jgi:hypothetical protein